MNYHVHIYRVKEKFEVNVRGVGSEKEARERALLKVRKGKAKKDTIDCDLIAVTFPGSYPL